MHQLFQMRHYAGPSSPKKTPPTSSFSPAKMRKIKSLIKSILLVYYLALVVLTLPLAFDVGGVQCGLAYSFTLMATYFCLTTLRLVSRRFSILRVISGLYYAQHLFIPSVLMVFLSMYAPDENEPLPVVLTVWRYVLIHLTLVFTIAEGFCLLLLIQAASQTLTWLTRYKSDSWLFVSLIGSGTIITGALYFLYRIYVNPFTLELGNASLLGSFLTLTVSLGLYGIVSGKGSMIESSLLFAYIVRCIYETFPLFSEDATQTIAHLFTQTTLNLRKEITRLPQPVSETILSAILLLASNIPKSFLTIWKFFIQAIQVLSLTLIFNLAYRIGVFYAATKIIPLLYQGLPFLPPRTPQVVSRQVSSSSVSTLQINDLRSDLTSSRRPSGRIPLQTKSKPPSTVIRLIYAYSPCIIIAVYTHLMLLYSGELGTELKLWGWWAGASPESVVVVHPWQFWNWVNMLTTLVLYISELVENADSNSAMTSHWKVD
ncbi:hypothetical protein PUMCH_001455 [Australozyma saopauloensis]|uniref:Uncharacterized protein n=1 Tax=Australozyma saopauloensis TaxID=291208 RepID=A0AAX4H6J0_9ASCO|nr:hypothetical protein PUMCH_001455 [[Candida] saopauloensis]